MEISDDYKKMFVKEINFVAKKMDESPDAFSKLYYFSGLFGFLHRILNLEFHPDLVVAHSILKTTYGDFMTRLQHLVKEPDKTVILTEEQMNKLSSLSKELGKKRADADAALAVRDWRGPRPCHPARTRFSSRRLR